MANKEVFGSTISLHTAAAGDTIPREYHRKVLKKIAQLTKVGYTLLDLLSRSYTKVYPFPRLTLQVVHSLQTKNDEYEETAQQLQTQHEMELQRVTEEGAALQQQLREERRRADQLQIHLETAQEEKGKLIHDQVHKPPCLIVTTGFPHAHVHYIQYSLHANTQLTIV